jgi:hypothetical protein
MASDLAAIRPGDTPFGTRPMRMEAAPIPLHAEERAESTASRRNEKEHDVIDVAAPISLP